MGDIGPVNAKIDQDRPGRSHEQGILYIFHDGWRKSSRRRDDRKVSSNERP